MMNDEQNSKDEDDFLDYEEDDPVVEDNYSLNEEGEEEEEAEEPAVRSPITEFKWKNYGTRSRVEESRRNHLKLPHETFGKYVNLFFDFLGSEIKDYQRQIINYRLCKERFVFCQRERERESEVCVFYWLVHHFFNNVCTS